MHSKFLIFHFRHIYMDIDEINHMNQIIECLMVHVIVLHIENNSLEVL